MLLNLVYFIGGMFGAILFIGVCMDLILKNIKINEFIVNIACVLFTTILLFMSSGMAVLLLVPYTIGVSYQSKSIRVLLEAFNFLPELKYIFKK